MREYDNHYTVFLNEGENTIAYLSLNQPKGLIVFVHGLAGHATTTWADFQIVVKNYSEFKDYDIIFYGYASLNSGASSNALLFYQGLKKFSVPIEQSPEIHRTITEGYKNIILVAHSLGAIVVRRALLFAGKDNADWLPFCKMFLLAPAHKGSYIQGMINEVLPVFLKIASIIYKYKHPVINDLEQDSVTIKRLTKDCSQLLRKKKGEFTKSQAVLWSMNDKVVLNEPFGDDATPELEMQKDHMGVCKLILGQYMKPLDELKKLM